MTYEIAPPPEMQDTPLNWVKKNLFSPWYNGIITVVIVAAIAYFSYNFWTWATTQAQWDVIPRNLKLLMVGRYPSGEFWRLWTLLGIISAAAGLSWGIIARSAVQLFNRKILIALGAIAIILGFTPTLLPGQDLIVIIFGLPLPVHIPLRLILVGLVALVAGSAWVGRQAGRAIPNFGKWISLSWFLVFLLGLWLIGGGYGLREVSTNEWQGLLLTTFTATISIVLCFPLGVLMALGRQSSLPILRWLSVAYIELVRGVPLITILFMGQIMIPLFLPEGVRPDRVIRAIVGLTFFSAAYLAENVRGGLQAIPRGQSEAAQALGLNTPLTLGLIVLPQALKAAIPTIVGQFISLFQDTTLLAIVGLVELLGIGNSILANPKFLGRFSEVYLFDALLFWVFCYAMSLASRWVENKLNVDRR